MKISVITVVYNSKNALEQTIDSVISQTYPNIEYIVVDGNSTDGTKDVIFSRRDNIDKFISEPDGGIYDAMNKGILLSSGAWILFMNAGDIFSSNDTVESMVQHINGEIGFIRGNIIRKYKHFRVNSTGITKDPPQIIDMFNNTFHHQATLINKQLFEQFGLYSTKYKLCSDWKFIFDCVILHGIKSKYINIPIAIFSMDGASTINYDKYNQERRSYLISLYGEEIVNALYELIIYRKSFFAKSYYKLWCYVKRNTSKDFFYKLLIIKRFFRKIFGMKVS